MLTKTFKKAMSLSDSNHKTKYFYGRYLFQNDKFKEAIDYFLQVNNLVPHYLDTHEYILISYHKLKDWEKYENLQQ